MTRLVSVLLILFSGACYSWVAEVDRLLCDRDAGVCTVTQSKVYGSSARSFRVADLSGAQLGHLPGRSSRRGTDMSWRVVILTRQEPIPLMGYATAFAMSEMEGHVGAIRRYVATPSARRLELTRDNRIGVLLSALVPLAIGGAILFASVRSRNGQERGSGRGR